MSSSKKAATVRDVVVSSAPEPVTDRERDFNAWMEDVDFEDEVGGDAEGDEGDGGVGDGGVGDGGVDDGVDDGGDGGVDDGVDDGGDPRQAADSKA